jgi:hypothetical protein
MSNTLHHFKLSLCSQACYLEARIAAAHLHTHFAGPNGPQLWKPVSPSVLKLEV